MFKIIIVEDEKKLSEELKLFLESNGYEVFLITDFSDTLNSLKSKECDLILLDVNLPYLNGELICKEYRKEKDTPIIIITSKNTDIDEIISINYGADDFVTKPFNTQVLLARIERLLKRNNTSNVLKYDKLTIDSAKSMVSKDNQMIDLSRNEIKILYYLVKNKSKIVSRDDLMDYLWNDNEFIDDNTLTVNINRLRSKLSTVGYEDMIITKRGQGYIVL